MREEGRSLWRRLGPAAGDGPGDSGEVVGAELGGLGCRLLPQRRRDLGRPRVVP